MKPIISITIGAALSAAIVVGSSTNVARAGDEIDCSKAENWVERSSHYDKGTFVAHKIGFRFHGFKCNSGYCSNEPGKSNEWKDQGECKSGTEPK